MLHFLDYYTSILIECRFKIVQTVTPDKYWRPKRGSKFKIEIHVYRENVSIIR